MSGIYELNGVYGQTDHVQQAYADTCAIKSQQIILNDFGIPVTEDELVKYSSEHGWYQGDNTGTLLPDVGNLLEDAGIPCTRTSNANVYTIVDELSQGHKIIVAVDSSELWDNDSVFGKIKNWYNDFFNGNTPDHALIVAGIDATDPNNVQVIVTDPGNGDYHKAYPLEQFMDSWSDSCCYMVSTDTAVPQTVPGMENFDVETGHIDNVAGMDYTDFQIFRDLSYGIPPMPVYNEFGTLYSPMNSLVDGYFDVLHNDLMFTQLFNNPDYSFNNFLNPQVISDSIMPHMCETYGNGLNYINFSSNNDWSRYAALNDISSPTNDVYHDFLEQSILDFQAMNDLQSAMYCEQQQMMLDFCNNCGFDFYNTFMI